MNKFLLAAGLISIFSACSGDGMKDSGETGSADTDTDTDTDTDVDFAMTGDATGEGFSGDCANGLCIYTITTTTQAGDLELDMTETGDSFLYNENHTAFVLDTTNADGSETYRLELEWVTSLNEVVVNSTTLFNPDVGDGGVLDRTTWYFGAKSADGSDFDCRVTGDNTGYYADWCTNTAR
jgi:hypothetical protein